MAVLRKRDEQEDLSEKQYHKKVRETALKGQKKGSKKSEVWEKWHQFAEAELSIFSSDRCKKDIEEKNSLWERGCPVMFGDQLYMIPPEMGELKGLKVVRPGLHLGEFKKNRLEPSHSLALYLKKEQVKQWVSLKEDGPLIQKYLSGETIDCSLLEGVHTSLQEKGWVLMLVGNCSIGWAKLAGNTLKNHYPKGLRKII